MKRITKSTCTVLLLALSLALPSLGAAASGEQGPIILKTMGSLFFGGTVSTDANGETFHGDHGYAQFYIPQNSRTYPLVMWHGIGQSGKTYESTPDGREGFQAIPPRRDWSVYILDQPRRGRAGRTNAPPAEHTSLTTMRESQAWDAFRFGLWIPPAAPTAFSNVQMPLDGYSIDQFFRQQTPDTGQEPLGLEYNRFMGRSVGQLFEQIGPGVLVTHSNSGKYGWATVMARPDLVKAVVAYEPGQYVFPEGEDIPDIPRGEMHVGSMDAPRVPLEEFRRLTGLPILVIYGDNIASEPSNVYNSEVWRSASARGRQFVETVNRHGGDARIVFLPDLGLHGNTHIPFADLNNIEIADHLEAWLREKGLDGRSNPHQGPQKKSMELTIPLQR